MSSPDSLSGSPGSLSLGSLTLGFTSERIFAERSIPPASFEGHTARATQSVNSVDNRLAPSIFSAIVLNPGGWICRSATTARRVFQVQGRLADGGRRPPFRPECERGRGPNGQPERFPSTSKASRVRRSTFAALIIGGGTLLALPFRREPAVGPDHGHRVADQAIDETSLEMLVREVTQDVQAPVVFQPQTDYVNREPASRPERPLTYEDLAVPLDDDPLYAERFNAAVGVANRSAASQKTRRIADLERAFATARFENSSPPSQQGSSQRDPAQATTEPIDQSVGSAIEPPANRLLRPRPQATLTRTRDRSGPSMTGKQSINAESERWAQETHRTESVVEPSRGPDVVPSMDRRAPTADPQHSVLETLPADQLPVNPADGGRERHWIRQPD